MHEIQIGDILDVPNWLFMAKINSLNVSNRTFILEMWEILYAPTFRTIRKFIHQPIIYIYYTKECYLVIFLF